MSEAQVSHLSAHVCSTWTASSSTRKTGIQWSRTPFYKNTASRRFRGRLKPSCRVDRSQRCVLHLHSSQVVRKTDPRAQKLTKITKQASNIFHHWAQLPITPEEYGKKQVVLQEKYFPEAEPLPGVEKLLATLAATQNNDGASNNTVHIALATSSHSKTFEMKTRRWEKLFSVFPPAQRVLGDDSRIGKGRGKPLPDIYLLALETINAGLRERGETEITPAECLVFEDAVPGVEAGRRAGMRVIWCPHPGLLEAFKGREEEVLAGLTGEHKGKSSAEKEADEFKERRLSHDSALDGNLGVVGDGWAELLTSLEDFDYAKYGIRV